MFRAGLGVLAALSASALVYLGLACFRTLGAPGA